jgi:hypothetical protein
LLAAPGWLSAEGQTGIEPKEAQQRCGSCADKTVPRIVCGKIKLALGHEAQIETDWHNIQMIVREHHINLPGTTKGFQTS